MQIKNNTVRYHPTPLRLAAVKKSDSTKCWQKCGDFHSCCWEWKLIKSFWRKSSFYSQLALQIDLRENSVYVSLRKPIYTKRFTVTLFVSIENGDQPDDYHIGMDKLYLCVYTHTRVYIYTRVYSSVYTRIEYYIAIIKWVEFINLDNLMLSQYKESAGHFWVAQSGKYLTLDLRSCLDLRAVEFKPSVGFCTGHGVYLKKLWLSNISVL